MMKSTNTSSLTATDLCVLLQSRPQLVSKQHQEAFVATMLLSSPCQSTDTLQCNSVGPTRKKLTVSLQTSKPRKSSARRHLCGGAHICLTKILRRSKPHGGVLLTHMVFSVLLLTPISGLLLCQARFRKRMLLSILR